MLRWLKEMLLLNLLLVLYPLKTPPTLDGVGRENGTAGKVGRGFLHTN